MVEVVPAEVRVVVIKVVIIIFKNYTAFIHR